MAYCPQCDEAIPPISSFGNFLLTQHAQKMQYPQFREALLRIGEDEARHHERIAEKINEFGGSLPGELTIQPGFRSCD